jgi:hypothetical protein
MERDPYPTLFLPLFTSITSPRCPLVPYRLLLFVPSSPLLPSPSSSPFSPLSPPRSVKRLDEVYYGLVDLLRSSDLEAAPPVPRLALNA